MKFLRYVCTFLHVNSEIPTNEYERMAVRHCFNAVELKIYFIAKVSNIIL